MSEENSCKVLLHLQEDTCERLPAVVAQRSQTTGADDVIIYLSMSCGRSVRQLLLRSNSCRLLILRAQMGIDTNLFSAMSR